MAPDTDAPMTLDPLFYEVFNALPRQGPGDDGSTLRALKAAGELSEGPRVLDIGCGSGMQTLVLAKNLRGSIVALDNNPVVLAQLKESVSKSPVLSTVETVEGDIHRLDFPDETFDLLWAEGSVFLIGLERGLREWKQLLTPGGTLALTDLVWFVDDPPSEIREYLEAAGVPMRTDRECERLITQEGWERIESFHLPDSAWWDHYYTPMLKRISEVEREQTDNPKTPEIMGLLREEIRMFEQYSSSYGYTFFIMRKPTA